MGAELLAEEGTLKGLVLAFEGADEWIIGRDPEEATLVLEDAKVSRKHLKINASDTGLLATNLSETNPAEINDIPIAEPTLLQEGDKVKIGGTLFHFYPEGAPPPVIEDVSPPEPYPHETIFKAQEDEEEEEPQVDLTVSTRFILKVIAGPNTGAEFSLEAEKPYLVGTDTVACDIVFYDLSISKEHARILVTKEGEIFIEDLGSRNGVVIDRKRIEEKSSISPNTVVALGTSAFFIIDKEAPVETITVPPILGEQVEVFEEEELPSVKEEEEEEVVDEGSRKSTRPPISSGALLMIIILSSLAILMGIGMISLFKGEEIVAADTDSASKLQAALKDFPAVKFTYNSATGKLFLVGHLATAVQKSELLYNLQGLTFISGIDDNLVVDEAIWQEINILLSKHPQWKGVSMHSPKPGAFVLAGYLKTNKEAASLTDYMNLTFPFLELLQNQVVVEADVVSEVKAELVQKGFTGVVPTFSVGTLSLSGYVSAKEMDDFNAFLATLEKMRGVRDIKSYVVSISPEAAITSLRELAPGGYEVTGYSKHCGVVINVVINGQFYSRGENINGYTITSIQPSVIFLEKDGLQYKIEFNK